MTRLRDRRRSGEAKADESKSTVLYRCWMRQSGIISHMTPLPEQECHQARPYRLQNQIQHYEWGGRDDRAFIAHLTGLKAPPDQPFAELWMGAHPSAPSRLLDPEEGSLNLSTWLSEDPQARLGKQQSQLHGNKLPYLFKVLSAEQALSIQAHPDKSQAQRLHELRADHYPDDNHKPEIAIALDYLDALVGFISPEAYSKLLTETPELAALLGNEQDPVVNLQKDVFFLLNISIEHPDRIADCIQQMHTRLSGQVVHSPAEDLFIREYQWYGPRDVGLLFILLLNRIHLSAGQAIYLAPGVPHAYLRGNIVECMANSDNVVRLGLTEKFCDAAALGEILNFSEHTSYLVQTSSDGYLTEYLTPTVEFRVKSLSLLQGESRAFTYHSGLTMFLLVEGEIALKWGDRNHICSCMYRRGDVFIVPANLAEFTLHSKSHCKLFLVDIPV